MTKLEEEVDIPPELVALTTAAIHGLTSGDTTQGFDLHLASTTVGKAAAMIGIDAYQALKEHVTK